MTNEHYIHLLFLPYYFQISAVSLHGYKPKRQRFNDDFIRSLDFLKLNQAGQSNDLFLKKNIFLKDIEQAYNHCPYYRKKYANAGLSPSDFKQLETCKSS